MRLAVRAWALREAARAALLAGDSAGALAAARAAHALERSPRAQGALALALVATGDLAGACAVLAEAAATR